MPTQDPQTSANNFFNPNNPTTIMFFPYNAVVYSVSCSGIVEGYCWGCSSYFRAIREEDIEGALEDF